VRRFLVLVCALGCAANAPPSLPPIAPAVVAPPPTPSAEPPLALDTSWVRTADRIDLTYVEGGPAGSSEIHARFELVDRHFEIEEELATECPSALVAQCKELRRTVHRHATLPTEALRPLVDAIVKAHRISSPTTVRLADGDGVVQRAVVFSATSGGAPRVLSVGSTDDAPMELGTDRRWSVDGPSARALREQYDALAKALSLSTWIREENDRWSRSP
jgi:hypothetical protein